MRTLPRWGHLLPLLGATFAYYFSLGWLNLARREANRGERGQAPTRKRAYAELPTDDGPDEPFPGDWCPVHNHEFHGDLGQECPGCREEWEQTWALGEAPDEQRRRDDFNDQAMERAAAEEDERAGDGWYLDLVRRAELGTDPHDGWRA
jgi:hypothetical protein